MFSGGTEHRNGAVSFSRLERCVGLSLLLVSNDLILREPSVFIGSLFVDDYSLPLIRTILNVAFFGVLIIVGLLSMRSKSRSFGKPLFVIQCCAGAAALVLTCFILVGADRFDPLLYPLFFSFGVFAAAGLLFWIEELACGDPDSSWFEILASLFVSSLGYVFVLYAAVAFSAAALFFSAYALSLTANSRQVRLTRHASSERLEPEKPTDMLPLVKENASTLLCIAALNYVLTSSRMSLADAGTEAINIICALAICLSAALLFFFSFVKNRRVEMQLLYQVAFPFIALAFLLLPFMGNVLKGLYMLLATTLGTMGTTVLIYIALQAKERCGMPAVTVYGLFSGFVHIVLFLGLISGFDAAGADGSSIVRYSVSALVLVYLFLLIFILSYKRSRASKKDAAVIFLGSEHDFSAACSRVSTKFDLTRREAEIMESMAKGDSASSMATAFGISESTVRTHMKNLYKKLGVHTKAELVSLISASLSE